MERQAILLTFDSWYGKALRNWVVTPLNLCGQKLDHPLWEQFARLTASNTAAPNSRKPSDTNTANGRPSSSVTKFLITKKETRGFLKPAVLGSASPEVTLSIEAARKCLREGKTEHTARGNKWSSFNHIKSFPSFQSLNRRWMICAARCSQSYLAYSPLEAEYRRGKDDNSNLKSENPPMLVETYSVRMGRTVAS